MLVQRYWYKVLPSSVLTLLCPPIPFVPSLTQYYRAGGLACIFARRCVCCFFWFNWTNTWELLRSRDSSHKFFLRATHDPRSTRPLFISISFMFKSNWAWTLQMPVPYSPPSVESYSRTPSHDHSYSAVGAQITSLKLGDLVVPKLPRLQADVSDWGDWSLHQ